MVPWASCWHTRLGLGQATGNAPHPFPAQPALPAPPCPARVACPFPEPILPAGGLRVYTPGGLQPSHSHSSSPGAALSALSPALHTPQLRFARPSHVSPPEPAHTSASLPWICTSSSLSNLPQVCTRPAPTSPCRPRVACPSARFARPLPGFAEQHPPGAVHTFLSEGSAKLFCPPAASRPSSFSQSAQPPPPSPPRAGVTPTRPSPHVLLPQPTGRCSWCGRPAGTTRGSCTP